MDNNGNVPAAGQIIEQGANAAGTKIAKLTQALALVIARGGVFAGLRKQLRPKPIAFTRRRDCQRCSFHGPGCTGRGLMVMACHEPGHPLVVRCQAHLARAPRGDLFLGLIVPASGAVAVSGVARDIVANEAAELRATVARAMDPDVERVTKKASDRDRRWFQEHPGRGQYLRPALPEELIEGGGDGTESAFAAVWQIEPGIRFRFMRSHPDAAGVIRAYGQLADADQEAVALGFGLEARARNDANFKHRAELALERAWTLLERGAV